MNDQQKQRILDEFADKLERSQKRVPDDIQMVIAQNSDLIDYLTPNKTMTDNQKEFIETVTGIIESWGNTNDLNSPTLNSDIDEELRKLDFIDDIQANMLGSQIKWMLGFYKTIDKCEYCGKRTNGECYCMRDD